MAESQQENPTIFLIIQYISQNYMKETLSVKDISAHVFLSASYVCTFFKNETGRTLNQYITEYRMEKAKQLLQDSRYKIADISSKGRLQRRQLFWQKLQETHRIITFRIQGEEFTMSSPFHRLRQSYGDMSLQSKFTIVLILAVSIPVIMIGIFFYSRLYDMWSPIRSDRNRTLPPERRR